MIPLLEKQMFKCKLWHDDRMLAWDSNLNAVDKIVHGLKSLCSNGLTDYVHAYDSERNSNKHQKEMITAMKYGLVAFQLSLAETDYESILTHHSAWKVCLFCTNGISCRRDE